MSPPGVGYDDADIYAYDGTSFSRVFDANAGGNLPLPNSASLDGLVVLGTNHFYLSFVAATTTISGLGVVEDEDVVEYNNGVWSTFFDGTAHGLIVDGLDLDAISVVGNTLYFSTAGNVAVPGVGGTPDDADIYAWDGTGFGRVFDASLAGLQNNANVDGVAWLGADEFYLSFGGTPSTNVPGLGVVEDENIVRFANGVWSLYFNGTALGLNATVTQNINAFSLMANVLPAVSPLMPSDLLRIYLPALNR
jgi:hypothetical protein